MRDWAVCTIGTTAPLEIDRFEKPCAFEPYGSECRLIPTIRRDLAAAKTATPGGWQHLRIGNLLSEGFPVTFCIVGNDRFPWAVGSHCLTCSGFISAGAAVALMVWLYWTGFAMLVGAGLNEELAKISKEGKLQEKHEPPSIAKIDFAA